jgi:ATP-dependent DNA helicase DinG
MMSDSAPPLELPEAPAFAAGLRHGVLLSPDGEIETLTPDQFTAMLKPGFAPLVCHGPLTARRLGCDLFDCLDILELFAFVRPAEFTLPTIRGVAATLGLTIPSTLEHEASSLFLATRTLLKELSERADPAAQKVAWSMQRGGWNWGSYVIAALGETMTSQPRDITSGLRVWQQLSEWEEGPPPVPPSNHPVSGHDASNRLRDLLGHGAEKRQEQVDYAKTSAKAFAPREREGEPRVVLAEAGTGVGKTLGYIAPASLWAEKNAGTVWISTFTRNLQRQLDGELGRLHPDPQEKEAKVVIRKGRENYLCLLNYEDALRRAPLEGPNAIVALGLMARWIAATRDGDMIGGDFPAWLGNLYGRALTLNLTDTRGECIYSACAHYSKCFVEHTVRRAKQADIVVANHALVMVQAAMGGDEGSLPLRYIFDEGHHLFDASDAAFSALLSGRETAELRRWLVGAEDSSRSRSRGLKTRLEDLIGGDTGAEEALDEILRAARQLPGQAWPQRVGGGTPVGPTETFLSIVRKQVYARDGDTQGGYGLETETMPAAPELIDAAAELEVALVRLSEPLKTLVKSLANVLDTDSDSLDSSQRSRIEAMIRSLERRGLQQIAAWRSMLNALRHQTPEDFVDWFGVERIQGRDFDVGFHRHWIDPTQPFVKTVLEPSHGTLITSATLRDRTDNDDTNWQAAHTRTGVNYLTTAPEQDAQTSPFDYAARTKVLIVGDINRNNADAVSAAFRDLFIAAGGGGLGLFTAISRLRGVHSRIQDALENANIPLLAQHIDAMDTGTLVDMFRAEEQACLLGTDAVRDGVDVPGRSLRLIVFDRVPWPRPTILHKARRSQFGGRTYDEMLTRLKLKQAYGRLLRRATDKGVFVMLDRGLPTRLTTAFPDGVEIQRLGIADAIGQTKDFLQEF